MKASFTQSVMYVYTVYVCTTHADYGYHVFFASPGPANWRLKTIYTVTRMEIYFYTRNLRKPFKLYFFQHFFLTIYYEHISVCYIHWAFKKSVAQKIAEESLICYWFMTWGRKNFKLGDFKKLIIIFFYFCSFFSWPHRNVVLLGRGNSVPLGFHISHNFCQSFRKLSKNDTFFFQIIFGNPLLETSGPIL